MKRAACADQRPRELEVGVRVDEEPRVLRAEPEESELVETPAGDALILEGQLVGWAVGARLRTRICSNEQTPREFVGRT